METNPQNNRAHRPNLTADTAQSLEFKPIRNFNTNDDLLLLKVKLDICSLLVTEKNLEQAHQLLIINFLQQEFKDFSPFDIQDAIQKHLGGKLNCDTKFAVKMSAEYLGIIFKAYRVYKREKQAEEKKMLPAQNEVKPATPQENLKNLIDYVKKNNVCPEWGSNIYLSAYMAIKEPLPEEKKKFAEIVREKLKGEEKAQKTMQISFLAKAKISDLQRTLKIPTIFANHCRVEYVKHYLKLNYISK